MSSALALALNSFKSASTLAFSSVLAPGQQRGAQAIPEFLAMPAAEQKRHLEGSLLELNDGSFSFIPLLRGIQNAGKPEIRHSRWHDAGGDQPHAGLDGAERQSAVSYCQRGILVRATEDPKKPDRGC